MQSDDFNIYNFIKMNKGSIWWVICYSAIVSICTVIYPYCLKYVIDYMISLHNFKKLGWILVGMVIILLFQVLFSFISSRLLSVVVQKYILLTKTKILSKVVGNYLLSTDDVAKIRTTFASDFELVGNDFVMVILQATQSILVLVCYIIALVTLNKLLALIVLVSIPFVWLINMSLGRLIEIYYGNVQQKLDEVGKNLTELIGTRTLAIAFGFVKSQYQNSIRKNTELKNLNTSYTTVITFANSCTAIVSIVAPFIVLAVGSDMVLKKIITVGTLLTIFTYAGIIFMPISELLGIMPLWKELKVSSERINYCLSLRKSNTEFISFDNDTQIINYRGLSIGYNDNIIASNLTGQINHGLTYLIGNNGSGKSTFAKTIAGLLEYSVGKICLNKDYKVTYLDNDSHLFSGSVMFNLTAGLDSYDTDKLEELIQLLNLASLLEKTSDSLSLGQIQKIKLCRALLGIENNLLILDEVISNIDKSTQKEVYSYLMKNRYNVLIIDHNLDMEKYDNIIKF